MYLREHGACRKSDIYSEITTSPQVPAKLTKLESMGLIRIAADPQSPKTVRIYLTATGESVASHLIAIERDISSRR